MFIYRISIVDYIVWLPDGWTTHLKTYSSKWQSSPRFRGEKKKYLKPSPIGRTVDPENEPFPKKEKTPSFPCFSNFQSSIFQGIFVAFRRTELHVPEFFLFGTQPREPEPKFLVDEILIIFFLNLQREKPLAEAASPWNPDWFSFWDPYNGLLYSLYSWVRFHHVSSLYTANKQTFGHSSIFVSLCLQKLVRASKTNDKRMIIIVPIIANIYITTGQPTPPTL